MSPCEVVFLFDVDNTLLDNDRVRDDLHEYLESAFAPETCHRYWAIFGELGRSSATPTISERCNVIAWSPFTIRGSS